MTDLPDPGLDAALPTPEPRPQAEEKKASWLVRVSISNPYVLSTVVLGCAK